MHMQVVDYTKEKGATTPIIDTSKSSIKVERKDLLDQTVTPYKSPKNSEQLLNGVVTVNSDNGEISTNNKTSLGITKETTLSKVDAFLEKYLKPEKNDYSSTHINDNLSPPTNSQVTISTEEDHPSHQESHISLSETSINTTEQIKEIGNGITFNEQNIITENENPKIFDLMKFAHDQAEETRVMLERLNKKDPIETSSSTMKIIDNDNTNNNIQNNNNNKNITSNVSTPKRSNINQIESEEQSHFDDMISVSSTDSKKADRIRLISEAKAKAALEKKAITDKIEIDKKVKRNEDALRRDKKNEDQQVLLDESTHSGHSSSGSIPTTTTSSSSSRIVPNGSKYTAVLSISKEDARRAAVIKVRQEAKKAAEAKARAEIQSREAKLKALLAADRDARIQKRMHDAGATGTGIGTGSFSSSSYLKDSSSPSGTSMSMSMSNAENADELKKKVNESTHENDNDNNNEREGGDERGSGCGSGHTRNHSMTLQTPPLS
eukprot:gene12510-26359_t